MSGAELTDKEVVDTVEGLLTRFDAGWNPTQPEAMELLETIAEVVWRRESRQREINSDVTPHNHPESCKYLGNNAWDCGILDNEA